MQTLYLLHIVQQWNSRREKKLKEMDQNKKSNVRWESNYCRWHNMVIQGHAVSTGIWEGPQLQVK